MDKYISLKEFTQMCKKNGIRTSEKTIKKRYKEIPGIIKENDEYKVLEGTRYPINKNFKVKNTDDVFKWMLKAIYKNRYIDYTYLGIYQNDFDFILKELLNEKYIKNNRSKNRYGANSYSITQKGIELMNMKEFEIEKRIEVLSRMFVGPAIALLRKGG